MTPLEKDARIAELEAENKRLTETNAGWAALVERVQDNNEELRDRIEGQKMVLRDVATSGVEWATPGYTTVQIDSGTWVELRQYRDEVGDVIDGEFVPDSRQRVVDVSVCPSCHAVTEDCDGVPPKGETDEADGEKRRDQRVAPGSHGDPSLATPHHSPIHNKEKFASLSERLKRDTAYASKSNRIMGHAAYRAIIAMGDDAVPWILSEMEQEPSHYWCIALNEITGEDPIPAEHYGLLDEVTKDWLDWGRANRHNTKEDCDGVPPRRL